MDGLTRLTEGVVVHRPLELGDVAEHLAGEDEELVRWLNGGPGTHETVEAHARACLVAWQARGPMYTFSATRHGVLEASSRRSSQCGVRPLALRIGFRSGRRGGEGELDWYVRDLPAASAPIGLDSAERDD